MDHELEPDSSHNIVRGPRQLFIVGVDGTDSGLGALQQAAEYADGADARILCVHVRPQLSTWELVAYLAPGAAATSRECRDIMEMRAWLQCVQVLDAAGRSWGFKVVSGRPERCLAQIALAEHGDALFVGQLPRSPWSRWFHRCPARKLARSSVCPVHRPWTD